MHTPSKPGVHPSYVQLFSIEPAVGDPIITLGMPVTKPRDTLTETIEMLDAALVYDETDEFTMPQPNYFTATRARPRNLL